MNLESGFQNNVGTLERVASAAGGALLLVLGLGRRSLGGISLAATGGALLFRGVTGFCPVNAAVGRDSTEAAGAEPRDRSTLEIQTTVTVQKPRADVYAFWRRLENLPAFMEHIEDVRQTNERLSHWAAVVPKTDRRIEWDAELQAIEENRRLSWRSVEGSEIENAGEVRLEDAPGGRGTEVHVRISYRPPAGAAGHAVARLLNPAFEQMVKEDIRRFKNVIEAGETPTTAGQPAGA